MNVDNFERDTTRVATFTFPNSVNLEFGIASTNSRNCSGVGFQTMDFGSTGRDLPFAEAFTFRRLSSLSAGCGRSVSVMKSSSRDSSIVGDNGRKDCAGKRALKNVLIVTETVGVFIDTTLIRALRTFSRKREKALATLFIAAPSPATAGEGGRRPGEGRVIEGDDGPAYNSLPCPLSKSWSSRPFAPASRESSRHRSAPASSSSTTIRSGGGRTKR